MRALSCNNFLLNSCLKLLQPTFSGPITTMSDRSFRPRPRSFAATPPSGASSTSSAPTGTASETCAGGPCPAEGPTSARIHSRSSTCQTRTPPLDDSGTAKNGENHTKIIRPPTPVPQSQRSRKQQERICHFVTNSLKIVLTFSGRPARLTPNEARTQV